MYERSYGYRYDEQENLSTTDISRLIRRDIKQAIGEGLLPARWKYSVRTRYASMMSAIDLEVKDCADAWQECDGTVPGTRHVWPDGSASAEGCPNVWCAARNDPQYAHAARPHNVLTEEARAANMTLKRIHSAYNHDGSDAMTDYFDVNYYGHVEWESVESAEWRERQKAAKAAAKAAKAAATDKRIVRVFGRQKCVTHVAAEVNGKVKLMCGAQLWRSSLVDVCSPETAITCSRCQKHAPTN